MPDNPIDDDAVGYGSTPQHTRFPSGTSGNPAGRPIGRHRKLPYDVVLGRTVMIREDGVAKRVTASEAFILKFIRDGLKTGGRQRALALKLVEEARARREAHAPSEFARILIEFISPESVNMALRPLKMAVKLDALRPTARMALEPWLVEAALARLGDRRLSRDEQAAAVKATRTPKKVRWPVWWEVRPWLEP